MLWLKVKEKYKKKLIKEKKYKGNMKRLLNTIIDFIIL